MIPKDPQSPAATSGGSLPLTARTKGWDRVLVLTLILVTFSMTLRPLTSPDIWHHLGSGRFVVENGGPAHTDPFSCTAHGKTWIQFEWLAQLIIYGLYSAGGANALMFFQAVIIALAAVFLAEAARRVEGSSLAASVVVVALAMMAASERFFARPESMTFLAFAVLCFLGENVRRTGKGAWAPALVMIPWVNMHGAWPAGLAWLGLTAAGETAEHLFRPSRSRGPAAIRGMWLALGLATAATLVNPYGWRIWEVPLSLTGMSEVRKYINEWKSPQLDYWIDPRHLGMYVFLAAAVIGQRALRISDWLILIFSGYLLQNAVRHIAIAMIMAAPSVAPALRRSSVLLAESLKKIGNLAQWGQALAMAVCLGALLVVMGGPAFPAAGLGINESKVPVGATEFLAKNHLDGNLFNTYTFGNYLLFKRYPQNPVFIDGRIDMYGQEVLQEYGTVSLAKEGWENLLRKLNVQCLFLSTVEAVDKKLFDALQGNSEWALVYWDDNAAVYVRRDGAHAEFVKNSYVYSIQPNAIDTFTANPASLEKAETDFRHKLSEDPSCAAAAYGLALCLEATGRVPEAMTVLCDTIALRPQAFMLYMAAGKMLLDAEKFQEAIVYYEGALANGVSPRPAYAAISIAYYRLGQLAKAIEYSRLAVNAAPENPYMHMNLSVLLEGSGDNWGALHEAREALRLEPRDPAIDQRVRMLEAKTGR